MGTRLRCGESNQAIDILMRWILFFLAFSVSPALFSQTYFNQIYSEGIRSFQVVEADSSYYAVAYSRNAVLPNGFLTLFKTNDQGVLQKTFSIIDSARTIFPSNHISLEKTLDSNFITVYSKNIVGSTRENGLIKFDSNLDTIWTRVPR